MSLNVAIQMDPINKLDIITDTSFALGLEAQARGHHLWYYTPDRLSYEEGQISAFGQALKLFDNPEKFFEKGTLERRQLSDMDVVLMRQDPPFDMAYITATHLLEMLPAKTFVVNNPAEVRNAPEKLLVNRFADLMPPTVISRDLNVIRQFKTKQKDIVIKPLFGNGGAGVFRLQPDDQNLNALLEMFFSQNNEPIMAQAYLPQIRKGDKRIILVNGQPIGAINRIPQDGEARSNLHVGGTAYHSELTERDHYICERIGPELKQRGLLFVGIDVIGDYLTEINVTSPTGIREIHRFTGINCAMRFWEVVEDNLGHHYTNGPVYPHFKNNS
tara:strand:- start:1525 stop:2514 length:990 start_codon:yes stop_codon:yes gene_type:complete